VKNRQLFASVFISYSRRDTEFVDSLENGLLSMGMTKDDIWIDRRDIPYSTDFMEEIIKGIQASDIFIIILTPDSVASEICLEEIQTALSLNKRIVPIECTNKIKIPEHFPDQIGHIHWVPMRNANEFQKNLDGLIETLNTDFAWVNEHTRILKRSIEWIDHNRNKSYLLRGDGLQAGEDFLLQAAAGKEPAATATQIEFIQSSQKDARARRRRNWFIAAAVTAVLLFLAIAAGIAGIIAVERADEAEAQTQVALSRQLAVSSYTVPEIDLDLKLLLALQANNFDDTLEARSSLIQALLVEPYLEGLLGGYGPLNFGSQDIGFDIENELNGVYRFASGDWSPIDEEQAIELFPHRGESLDFYYQDPTYSEISDRVAYAVCKHFGSGGSSSCEAYIAIWDNSHALQEFRKDPLCSSIDLSDLENLAAEYIGGGAFKIINEDSNEVIGTFLSDEIRMETQQYDQAEIVSMDIDHSRSTLVTAIAYGRHHFSLKIIIWDIASKQEIGTIYSGTWGGYVQTDQDIQLARFSEDQNTIISCGENVDVEPFVIIIDPQYLVGKACAITGRNLTDLEWDRFVSAEIPYEKTCSHYPEGGYPIWEHNPE
jgi:hypothetical protein